MDDRTVRVFFSSTFKDFGEERDLLVRRVFPALRARLKGRFVELVDVDLRWGITVAQAGAAEPLLDRALAIIEKVMGPEHPETVAVQAALTQLVRLKVAAPTTEPLLRSAQVQLPTELVL